jgi:hypothetical protein
MGYCLSTGESIVVSLCRFNPDYLAHYRIVFLPIDSTSLQLSMYFNVYNKIDDFSLVFVRDDRPGRFAMTFYSWR